LISFVSSRFTGRGEAGEIRAENVMERKMKRMSLWLFVLFARSLRMEIFMIIRKCFWFFCGSRALISNVIQKDKSIKTRKLGKRVLSRYANTQLRLQNGEHAKKIKDVERAAYLQSNRQLN
jgi:hypothetical protein